MSHSVPHTLSLVSDSQVCHIVFAWVSVRFVSDKSDSNIDIPTLLQKINLNNCSANSNPTLRKAQIFAKQ